VSSRGSFTNNPLPFDFDLCHKPRRRTKFFIADEPERESTEKTEITEQTEEKPKMI